MPERENEQRASRGRPPQYPGAQRTTVYLTPKERECLIKLGEGNVTEGVRRLLQQAAA